MNPVDTTLYAIVDPARAKGAPLPELARLAADNGATLIQYRDKHADTRAMVEMARKIVAALRGTGVPLLVNDRVDVALAASADGVHLGQSDMMPADARRLLGGDALIGLTIDSGEAARHAPVELIDYACIGGVFDTASKDNPASIGVAGWKTRARILRQRAPDLPVAAIAGIDAANAGSLIAAGADGVAVISAIFMADDIADATRELSRAIEQARQAR